jgi:hypothetical protein
MNNKPQQEKQQKIKWNLLVFSYISFLSGSLTQTQYRYAIAFACFHFVCCDSTNANVYVHKNLKKIIFQVENVCSVHIKYEIEKKNLFQKFLTDKIVFEKTTLKH